ncbi:serine hydrolase [Brevibacillus sp. TJ4]|uniref:serine hydrolase n=1 Tax=Brevibacillus sp. TJ4 TaxID=3234853 RepID=UPI003B9F1E06
MKFLRSALRRRICRTVATSVLLAVSLVATSAIPALAASNPSAKPLTPQTAEAFLDDFFASPYVESDYAGASVVIVQKDRIIAQKGYGYADLEKESKVNPGETVFRVASVSKTFTAVAIMQLVEQGKVDLQADIRTYLDSLEFENPYATPVTVEHLLTHRSGFEIRDPQPGDLHVDFSKQVSIEAFAKEHMPPVVREPGSSYMYDNFAYLLLGLIVQEVSGEPYEAYMEKHIFQPLQMEHSGFLLEGELLEHLATGYDSDFEPIPAYATTPTVMPHAGMVSSAGDIGALMIALLNDGKAPSGRILSKESAEAMFVYRSSMHAVLPDTTYGFEAAFQLPEAGSSPSVLTKAGDVPGYSSYLVLIPEHDTGFFLTNSGQGGVRHTFYSMFMNTFFPEYSQPAKLPPVQPTPVAELKKLDGLYYDLRLHSLLSTVAAKGDGLLTISDGYLGERTLRQVGDNLFIDEISKQFTAFHSDGKTVYMKEPYLNTLGYSHKTGQPAGFSDIAADHPYAPYIHALQSLNHYPNQPGGLFHPEQPVTRAEFVRNFLHINGVSSIPPEKYAFFDIEGHPDAAYIQLAYELGMLPPSNDGYFQPERPITRQEAAAMLWNLYRWTYPEELFEDVKLAGKTNDWAIPGVKMMVAFGYHGPEVEIKEDGAADFHSLRPMNRQEEAALLYQVLLQPIDIIASELMQEH